MRKHEIKVIVNYPQTEDGMRLLEERHAAAVVNILKEMLTKDELDQVMEKLKERQKMN